MAECWDVKVPCPASAPCARPPMLRSASQHTAALLVNFCTWLRRESEHRLSFHVSHLFYRSRDPWFLRAFISCPDTALQLSSTRFSA